MKPDLKPFPKGKLPADSVHTLRILDEKSLDVLKHSARYPKKLFSEIELTEREPVKGVDLHSGFGRIETFVFVRDETKTFTFHDGLRKAFSFDVERTESIVVDALSLTEAGAERALSAITALLILGAYEPKTFGEKAKKKNKKEKRSPLLYFNSVMPFAAARAVFEESVSMSEAANLVRMLAELPPNELRPSGYLARIRKLAKDWGARVEFFDQKALAKRGANAFLAVVRATPNENYGIVKLVYRPKGKTSGRKIALVGKGLCFDTGGYNIKGSEAMLDMHRDMTGSALALAFFGHLARSGSADEVECYLALAENLISATAYKPNEVVVASNGVSIEVVDTDAEGRMALSDTLVMACEGNPDLVVDYATLTGAIIRAIDTRRSGVFSNFDSLRELAHAAGEASGERVWGFPIGEDYWESIQSDIADLRQCAVTDNCDHIYAATFLSRFVKPETPWLHVDLASESHKGGLGLSSKDVTGFGIRFSNELLKRFDPSGFKRKLKPKGKSRK